MASFVTMGDITGNEVSGEHFARVGERVATTAPAIETGICVYTVLTGDYERLNEQTVAKQSQIPFICFTDDPHLRSDGWTIRVIPPLFSMDPVRSQRDVKIRPHLYLPEFDGSIYIDNSVILTEPPERLWDMLDPAVGFLLPEHSFRDTLIDEFLEVARLGLEDSARVFEQLNHYSLSHPDVLLEKPWWAAILVRSHRHQAVQRMQEIWAAHVHRYARRDQLSINLAFREAGVAPTPLCIDNFDSWFHHWPVASGRDRARWPRDPAATLMPLVARLRELERANETNARLQTETAALQERLHEAAEEAQGRAGDNARLQAATAALQDRLREVVAEAQRHAGDNEALRAELLRVTADVDSLREQAAMLHAVLASTSWRLFAPLRWVADRQPPVARLLRRSLKVIWWTLTLQVGYRFVLWRRNRAAMAAARA